MTLCIIDPNRCHPKHQGKCGESTITIKTTTTTTETTTMKQCSSSSSSSPSTFDASCWSTSVHGLDDSHHQQQPHPDNENEDDEEAACPCRRNKSCSSSSNSSTRSSCSIIKFRHSNSDCSNSDDSGCRGHDKDREEDQDDDDQQDDDTKLENEVLATNQSKTMLVKRYKWVAVGVLLFSSIFIAAGVYCYAHNSEEVRWSNSFVSEANKLDMAIQHSMLSNMIAMDAFATDMISLAKYTKQTWPFVTIPDFAIKANKLLSSSDGFAISLQPFIDGLSQRLAFENYTRRMASTWVNETLHIQDNDPYYYGEVSYQVSNITKALWNYSGIIPYDNATRVYLPQWQNYPTTDPEYNWDFLTASHATSYLYCVTSGRAIFVQPCNLPDPNSPDEMAESEFWSDYFRSFVPPNKPSNEPFSDFMYPVILDDVNNDDPSSNDTKSSVVVGTLDTTIYWRDFLFNQLPESSRGIVVVFENTCRPSFTYQIFGQTATYLGRDDHHNHQYDSYQIMTHLNEAVASTISQDDTQRYTGVSLDTEVCPFTISIYPSDTYVNMYTSNDPIIFAAAIVCIFAFVTVIFLIYDRHVEKRQQYILDSATKTSAVVSSLFPSAVRDQMLARNGKTSDSSCLPKNHDDIVESYQPLVNNGMINAGVHHDNDALASLYPDTTVFFADLAGFTAWSSSRSPSQVFTLLEILYGAFDAIAKKRKVFKVETIGDCYVAVTGLPNPAKNHAVIIARFAFDCLAKTTELTTQLVSTLGLETAELQLRIGLNSGPTTAGVLRGEKARFQLFGDTVNTASRMESTGAPGRIQVSQKTADLLILAGKGDWLHLRAEPVEAKGKGIMCTYWLHETTPTSETFLSSERSLNSDLQNCYEYNCKDKARLLVNWNVSVFKELILNLVAHRGEQSMPTNNADPLQEVIEIIPQGDPINEISECLDSPTRSVNCCNSQNCEAKSDHRTSLPQAVEKQLRELISTIAHSYSDNIFHNFEHASHVVASTIKLLGRIRSYDEWKLCCSSAAFTCPIGEEQCLYLDPLTRFGVVFAALVHDADHRGLSNFQLVERDELIARTYHGKSVAEQNSIDVAWKILMQPSFEVLRRFIFVTDSEVKRFRKVLVNTVMATDIFDGDLKKFREERWERVFAPTQCKAEPERVTWTANDLNRKNAIVVEHLIQASDVSHTMQHWKIYQKWNHKLFQEMYKAYVEGHSGKNPAHNWYVGELGFFDHYIIPLAKKLKICGVFGVSCDELFDYAIDNRNEWENKGKEIIQDWEEKERAYWENNKGL